MRPMRCWLTILILTSLLCSCGQGGGVTSASSIQGPQTSAPSAGVLLLNVKYAGVAKAKSADASIDGLPPDTSRLVVHVADPVTGRDLVAPQSVERTAASTSQTVVVPSVEVTDCLIVVVALDADGATLGYFTTRATVTVGGETRVDVASSVTLATLALDPTAVAFRVGETTPFSATATFSDGSSANVTSIVSWECLDLKVAEVSAAPGSAGVVAGLQAGATMVRASLEGQLAASYVIVVSESAPDGLTGVPPGAPSNVLVTTDGLPPRHARVTWDPPRTDGGSPLIGYWVEIRTWKPDGSPGELGGGGMNGLATTVDLTMLPPGETIEISVAAVNSIGRSPAVTSNRAVIAQGEGDVPSAPLNPQISTEGLPYGSLRVSFDPPLSDGGNPINNYYISYQFGNFGGGGSMGTQTSAVFFCTPGATARFWIAAQNDAGQGPFAESNVVTLPIASGTVPDAPRNALATVDPSKPGVVHLSWDPPLSNGGSDLLYYYANISTTKPDGSPGEYGGGGSMGLGTSGVYSSLPRGVTFQFSIRASNGVGDSAYTVSNSVVVP